MGNPLHFIQASDTSAFAALHTEQGAIPSQYEALQAHLKKIGLGRFGTLWAEPVTGQATPTGYASVSWYTPLEGVGTPLSRLDAGEAEQARTALRRAREAVTPHLDDTPGGILLRKALFIPSADNVFVVNGHPVLVNWGLLPQGTDEASAPILWGEPENSENGETPSGVAGAGVAPTGAAAAAIAATAAHKTVPGAGWRFRRNGSRTCGRNGSPRRNICRGNGGKRHCPAQPCRALRGPAPRRPARRDPAFPPALLCADGPGAARCPGNAPGSG